MTIMNWVSSNQRSDSAHWLLITSRTTWSYLRDRREWAFATKSNPAPDSIHTGDNAIIYLRAEGVRGPGGLGGAVDFIGQPCRTDDRGLFDQLFPLRIPIRVTRVVDPPVPFAPIVDQLEFVKNKGNWGGYLQGHAARRLNVNDFNLLLSRINKSE